MSGCKVKVQTSQAGQLGKARPGRVGAEVSVESYQANVRRKEAIMGKVVHTQNPAKRRVDRFTDMRLTD